MSNDDPAGQPSDEQLMAAYVAGDEGAFQVLFQRYAPLLLGLMRKARLTDPDARDLVQQTFLQLHRGRRDFRQGARLRPWLLTIAYNLRRDHFRRLGRRPEAPLEREPVSGITPATALERRYDVDRMRAALERLSADQREVIELHWMGGIPFPEIAAAMGLKVSTVKVRAHRGYRRLRGLLEEGL